MAGYEGYSVGDGRVQGVVGYAGYTIDFSTRLAGGTILITKIGYAGYTVEKTNTPRAIVRFRRK